MAKFGMSMCVLGMAEEFRPTGVTINALWPRTTIATAAIQNLLGGEQLMRRSRKPEVASPKLWQMRPMLFSLETVVNVLAIFFIDDDVLRSIGVTCFDD